jgi:hypothetical protein
LITTDEKQAGFIEYVPGEHTWRIVETDNYMVIHCLWVNSKKFSIKGMASALINECVVEASGMGKDGIAVVTSDGSWMTGKAIFEKNGFEMVDQVSPHFQLMAKSFNSSSSPSFPKNWDKRLERLKGLQLLHTNQCPYIGKALAELPAVAEKYNIDLKLVAYNDSKKAREDMLSPYGMFNLVYDGRLLADHPISATRFRNILERELKLKA